MDAVPPREFGKAGIPRTSWAAELPAFQSVQALPPTTCFAFTAPDDAVYALGATITQANHYGVLRFAIDGVPLASYDPDTEETQETQFDGYNSTSRASYASLGGATAGLGGATLTAGTHTLTVEVSGKHSACINYLDKGTSTTGINDNGYAFGIDYLRLTPLS